MNKKVRHQRTIKNGIVPIDDIDVEPGINFSNWIPEVRSKLALRESILLQKRVDKFNQIITSTLTQFYDENMLNFPKHHTNPNPIDVNTMHSVNSDNFHQSFINGENVKNIKKKCEAVINQQLSNWKGVRRSKKVVKVFRDYFKVSKNWFDQRKIELLATHFCIPILSLVYTITTASAAQFFENRHADLQQKYSCYLCVFLLRELCRGIIKLPNCGERLLIPAGVHLTIGKHEIPFFELMMKDQQSLFEENKGAKNVRKAVMELMDNKYEVYKHDFVTHLQQTPAIKIQDIDIKDTSIPSNPSLPPPPPSVVSTGTSSTNLDGIQERIKPEPEIAEYPVYRMEAVEEEKISIPDESNITSSEQVQSMNLSIINPSPLSPPLITGNTINSNRDSNGNFHFNFNLSQNLDDDFPGHFDNDLNDNFNFNNNIISNFNDLSDCNNNDTFNFNFNQDDNSSFNFNDTEFNFVIPHHFNHPSNDHIYNDHHRPPPPPPTPHQPPPPPPPQLQTIPAPQFVSTPSSLPLPSLYHIPMQHPNWSPVASNTPYNTPHAVGAVDPFSPITYHHRHNRHHHHPHHQFTGHGYINHHDSTYHLESSRWSPY